MIIKQSNLVSMRVLIADDHPLYLSAVREQIERLFPGVATETACTLTETLDILTAATDYDLLLIDYAMPGMNGRDGIQAIVAKARGTPMVVMSGVAIASEVSVCIGVGAKGFLPKTLDGKVFASALNVVLAGGSYLPAEMFGSPCAPVAAPDPAPADDCDFAERELTIMAMVVEGKSNKEIARLLNLREVTVKVQLTRIYKKLGAKNRAQAATLMAQGHVLG
ncbi:MAG: response regulator transcription factor [Phaeospirillum sp.]|nr:response regulator transcription factor [Phaeospirillum sp.]